MHRALFVRPIVIALVCSLLSPWQLPGQQPAAAGDWDRVRKLPAGTPIWVKARTAAYHGELIGTTPDSLRLDSDEHGFPGRATRRRELLREDVLQVRRFSRGGSALAGAGIGAAAGGGIGLAIDLSARSNEDRGLATAVLLLLGAVIGWAVGRHSTLVKGEILYTAP